EELVHAAEPARVHLAEADRLRLQQLLEDDWVLAGLAGRDADRRDRARDRRVAEHVVRARRLLDPVRIELREALGVGDGLADVPDLVRVEHELALRPEHLARDARATDVLL